jgi:YHS domain-containing protein
MKLAMSMILAASALTAFAFAEEPTTKPATVYPLTACVISKEPLPAEGATVKMIDGREVRFCCEKCVAAFEKDPQASHKKMDEQIVEASKASYPLKDCLVSGEPLGGMGEPVKYVHRPTNQLVQFCCSSCVKQFEKNPAPYLAKLEKAAK